MKKTGVTKKFAAPVYIFNSVLMPFLYSLGDLPVYALKVRLKYDEELKPSFSAISSMDKSDISNIFSAFLIQIRFLYSIGVMPVSFLNTVKNLDGERLAIVASSWIVKLSV